MQASESTSPNGHASSTLPLHPEELQEVQECDLTTLAIEDVVMRGTIACADRHPARRGGFAVRRGLLSSMIFVVAIVAGVTAFALRTGRTPTSETPPQAQALAPEPRDVVAEIVGRARQMAKDGDRSGALDLVLASRVTYPDDARLPRAAGSLYFEQLWWADGIKQLRSAFELDPTLRGDPEIVAIAVTGFITTPTYNVLLGRFLREDIGVAATPNLEQVAREHRNPAVRARARAALQRMAVR